jgi:hypothetical protein
LTPKPDCHPLREPPQNNGYPTNTLDNGPNLQPFGPPSARNPSQHMSLLIVHFLGCPNCNILPERACGSLARHPTHGPAVITCFHGPVSRRGRCTCTPPPGLISGDGAVLSVLETVEARDVAWLSIKVVPRTPREVSANTPMVGDTLTVVLPGGTVQATVRGVLGRDDPQNEPIELDLNTAFQPGDSGCPILNTQGEVIAVVRNTGGRCGFVLDRPQIAPWQPT